MWAKEKKSNALTLFIQRQKHTGCSSVVSRGCVWKLNSLFISVSLIIPPLIRAISEKRDISVNLELTDFYK